MSPRFYAVILFLIFVASTGSLVMADQQSLMTPVSSSNKPIDDEWYLRMYEAAGGDISLCANKEDCLVDAQRIRSWFCAADVCAGADKSRKAINCFEELSNKYSKEAQEQIDSSFCSLLASPNTITRKAFLGHIGDPNLTEDRLVKYVAFVLALKGPSQSCQDHIKNYVGPYGPQWKSQWYKALSGCRILTRERTREQEEKDLSAWAAAKDGAGRCSDIVNIEMRKVCDTPQAASPSHE